MQELGLGELVGLEEVKEFFIRMAKSRVYNMRLNEIGVETQGEGTEKNLNLVLLGNPGTGKTTTARIIGQIYKRLGMLNGGEVVELNRHNIVGKYIGHTEERIKEILEGAIREQNIVFIDEFYNLVKGDDGRDFGSSIIDTLLAEMENNRGKFAVIIAGYEEETLKVVNRNPGLASRFNNIFNLPDFTPGQLMDIYIGLAKKDKKIINQKTNQFLRDFFEVAYQNREPKHFANARFVRNLYVKSVENMSTRLYAGNHSRDEMLTILPADVRGTSEYSEVANKLEM